MKLRKSLAYMLILTLIGSFLAYKIVVKAYDGVLNVADYESQIDKSK